MRIATWAVAEAVALVPQLVLDRVARGKAARRARDRAGAA